MGAANRLYLGAGTADTMAVQPAMVGINGLPTTNALEVFTPTGIRQGRLYISGGDQGTTVWNSITYNAYHNAANNGWVFPDNTKPAMTIEFDSLQSGGRFQIYTATKAAPTTFVQRLALDGENGNLVLSGGLGLGTSPPGAKLDITANTQAWGGWFEAIRFSQAV